MNKSRKRERLGPRPAADRCFRLEHADGLAGGREDEGRRETIGPGANDDRIDPAATLPSPRGGGEYLWAFSQDR